MAKKLSLGKGLGALLGDTDATDNTKSEKKIIIKMITSKKLTFQ